MRQPRAKQGGEVGPNGEFYEGGKFIATTDHAKSRVGRKTTGRVETESGIWVEGREGWRPLFGKLAGVEEFVRPLNQFRFNSRLRIHYAEPAVIEQRHAMIAAWNAGKRWISSDTSSAAAPRME